MSEASGRVKGYIIVDKVTGEIDWDCDLHPTREAAIASMCGANHMYVESREDVDENSDRISVYWADDYEICTVLKVEETA